MHRYNNLSDSLSVVLEGFTMDTFTLMKEGCVEVFSPCAMVMMAGFMIFILKTAQSRMEIFVAAMLFIFAAVFTKWAVTLGLVESFLNSSIFIFITRIVFILIFFVLMGLGAAIFYDWWLDKKFVSQSAHRSGVWGGIPFFSIAGAWCTMPLLSVKEAPAKKRWSWFLLGMGLSPVLGFVMTIFSAACPARYFAPVMMYMLSLKGERQQLLLASGLYVLFFVFPFALVSVVIGVMGGTKNLSVPLPYRGYVKIVCSALCFSLGAGLLSVFLSE